MSEFEHMMPIFQSGKSVVGISIAAPLPIFEPGYNLSDDYCMLSVSDDWNAILSFLTEFRESPNTLKSYSKEMERLILWLVNHQKPLSAFDRADWNAYKDFLKCPPAHWCGQKAPRFAKNSNKPNSNWRPFAPRKIKSMNGQGMIESMECFGLSESSLRLAKKIVEALFSYLVDNNYLRGNPVIERRTRNSKANNEQQVAKRFLDEELIDFVIDHLYQLQQLTDDKSEIKKLIRARYLIQFLAGTGLRIDEAASHKFSSIQIKDKKWYLTVVGKGNKLRTIEILPDLKVVIEEFRHSLGLSSTPLYGEQTSLIPAIDVTQSISARRVDQILRWAFELATSEKIRLSNSVTYLEKGPLLHDASLLSAASAHWLRHSHATYFLRHSGNDLKRTMDRLGHSDVSTTMIYQHLLE